MHHAVNIAQRHGGAIPERHRHLARGKVRDDLQRQTRQLFAHSIRSGKPNLRHSVSRSVMRKRPRAVRAARKRLAATFDA